MLIKTKLYAYTNINATAVTVLPKDQYRRCWERIFTIFTYIVYLYCHWVV